MHCVGAKEPFSCTFRSAQRKAAFCKLLRGGTEKLSVLAACFASAITVFLFQADSAVNGDWGSAY
jgi:hypothetical protein